MHTPTAPLTRMLTTPFILMPAAPFILMPTAPLTHIRIISENTKAVLNRMNRAIGHMEAVRTMIEDDRDCSEVLVQIAAVRSAINNIGKIILEDHISHCLVDAVETGDEQVIRDLNDAIDKFVK